MRMYVQCVCAFTFYTDYRLRIFYRLQTQAPYAFSNCRPPSECKGLHYTRDSGDRN